MNIKTLLIVASVLVLSACGSNSSEPMTTWSFSGSNGPEFWHLVVDTNGEPYTTCKYGQTQSPIDIPAASLSATDLNNIDFQYQSSGVKSTNLGYSIYGFDIQTTQGETNPNRILVDGVASELEQIHLHTPSEHKIEGKLFDGSMHFVHQDASGTYTFIAVLLQVGERNPNIAILIEHLPDSVLKEVVPEFSFDITSILPPESQRASFRYTGSFTVPPCTENVKWIVMQTPLELSQDQLEVFQTLFDGNTRPTQPINNRTIEADSTPSI